MKTAELPTEPSEHALDDPFVDKHAVSAFTGLAIPTIDRWIRQGHLPRPVKFGRTRGAPIRWRRSTIARWATDLEAGTGGPIEADHDDAPEAA